MNGNSRAALDSNLGAFTIKNITDSHCSDSVVS